LQRDVFFASKKAEEGATLECVVVSDGTAEHGVASLESIEDRANSNRLRNFECDISVDVREVAKMVRQSYSD